MSEVATRVSVTPLHPLFVAEIGGIDLTVPVSREDFRAIWDAFNEHQILVFRNQPFDDAHRSRSAGTSARSRRWKRTPRTSGSPVTSRS